ncbi:hypothetical protein HPB50_025802 [Hyalomma asiaticum]|uniref:Uncharacterized protein n=1 Tax=Hyalomma asiaticum TaxID=266040 RepID=A0ACB7SQB2_HYAAI|nr:hypothetical protein HPB50_025802 [Hyalomma asiaticum]
MRPELHEKRRAAVLQSTSTPSGRGIARREEEEPCTSRTHCGSKDNDHRDGLLASGYTFAEDDRPKRKGQNKRSTTGASPRGFPPFDYPRL